MNLPEKITAPAQSLREQRLELRRRLREQREIIAFKLTPHRELGHSATGTNLVYPRSLTMRLLRHNPAPVIKLAIGAASWLFGARVSNMLQDGMQFLKMVRTGATHR